MRTSRHFRLWTIGYKVLARGSFLRLPVGEEVGPPGGPSLPAGVGRGFAFGDLRLASAPLRFGSEPADFLRWRLSRGGFGGMVGGVLPSVDSRGSVPRAVGAFFALALGMMAVFGVATWLLLLGSGR